MATTEAEYLASLVEMDRTGFTPPLHVQMGLKVIQLSPTTILTMELSDAFRGAAPGSIHGGILATFADITSAYALWNSFDMLSELPVTTDLHVRYYRQPRSGPLSAEASVVHNGRRLLGTECSVTDAEHRVLARTSATYMIAPLSRPQGG